VSGEELVRISGRLALQVMVEDNPGIDPARIEPQNAEGTSCTTGNHRPDVRR
jgi:hypothetical protein